MNSVDFAERVQMLMAVSMGAREADEAAERLGILVEELRTQLRELAPKCPELMPISADITQQSVELFDLAGATLAEPFLHESVRRFEGQQRLRFEVDFDLLIEASTRRSRAPDGFIFHIGRCGSTLLSNLLSASGRHVVLREPDTVSHLMAGMLLAPDSEQPRLAAALRASVLYSLGVAQRIVPVPYHLLKLSAWNVVLGEALLSYFPNAPAVFVHRSPLDTVASLLATPPSWAQLVDRPREMQALFFPSLREDGAAGPASPVELYAHAFRSCAQAALALPRERVSFVEYRELLVNPRACLLRVLAHLGHAVSADRIEDMLAATRVYSKDPLSSTPFNPNGVHGRAPLNREQGALVDAVTRDVWHALQRATVSSLRDA